MKISKLININGVNVLTKNQLQNVTASIDLDCEDPIIANQFMFTLCYDPDHACLAPNE